MERYLDLSLIDRLCFLRVTSALRQAFSTADAVVICEKMEQPHDFAFAHTVGFAGKFKIFQGTDDQDGITSVWSMWLHLRGHTLRHFSSVFENRSVIVCRLVRQAVRAIVVCFHEAIIYWVNHCQLLFVKVSTGLAPISIATLGSRAWAQSGWLRGRCFQATIRLGVRWPCISILLAIVAPLRRAVTALLIFSIKSSATWAPGFEHLVQSDASGNDVEWSGGVGISIVTDGSWMSSSFTALITRFLTKAATGAVKPGSLMIFPINTCLHKLVRSFATVKNLAWRLD